MRPSRATTALALKPDYAEAFCNRGNAFLEIRAHTDALADFDRALAVKPDFAEALNNRCNALFDLKRYGECAATAERFARAAHPDFDYARGVLFQAQRMPATGPPSKRQRRGSLPTSRMAGGATCRFRSWRTAQARRPSSTAHASTRGTNIRPRRQPLERRALPPRPASASPICPPIFKITPPPI